MINRPAMKRALGAIASRVRRDDSPRCLVFHDIVATDERDQAQMTVSLSQFEEQLDLLIAMGYRVSDAAACVRDLHAGRALPDRTVVLTFDDGLSGVALAAAALARRGMTATLFVTTGYVSGRTRAPRAALSLGELRDVLSSGVFVPGAHGASHVSLRKLADDSLTREVEHARHALADLLGRQIDLFAYPFGSFDSWDARVQRVVARAGFTGAFTAIYGPLGGDPYTLGRYRMSWAEDATGFAALMRGGYDWYRWVQRVQAIG